MTIRRSTLLALAALTLACAGAGKQQKKEVVWPDPPETPRVRFVSAFRTTDDLGRSNWADFKKSLFGAELVGAMDQPMSLALSDDGQRLYITDFTGSTLWIADFQQKTVKPFGEKGRFSQPFGVALDAAENVYVSDAGAKTLVAFDKAGNKLWTVAKGLERPTGLALDKKRQLLYVSDSSKVDSQNHRVLAYDLKGQLVREIGSGRGIDDGQFVFPVYLAVDTDGNLYVGDTMNFRIQVFDPDGKFARKFGEHGDGPGSFARLKGLAFDGFGNLYTVDGQHSVVQIFNKDFDALMYFGGFAPYLEYFDIPSGIAIDPKTNRIYVCNQQTPRVNVYELINTRAEDSLKQAHHEEPAASAAAH